MKALPSEVDALWGLLQNSINTAIKLKSLPRCVLAIATFLAMRVEDEIKKQLVGEVKIPESRKRIYDFFDEQVFGDHQSDDLNDNFLGDETMAVELNETFHAKQPPSTHMVVDHIMLPVVTSSRVEIEETLQTTDGNGVERLSLRIRFLANTGEVKQNETTAIHLYIFDDDQVTPQRRRVASNTLAKIMIACELEELKNTGDLEGCQFLLTTKQNGDFVNVTKTAVAPPMADIAKIKTTKTA